MKNNGVELKAGGVTLTLSKPVTIAQLESFYQAATGKQALPALESANLIGINSDCDGYGWAEFYTGKLEYRTVTL